MTHVSIQGLTKFYKGGDKAALDRLSLEISSGELIALLGPSGCGKTTALKMIAGLLAPSSGGIFFNDQPILDQKPEDRGAVMVFQNYLLFPYMNVADNVGFGLKMSKTNPAEITRRVDEILELVQLPDFGGRMPHELSGGQQQRVALARALVLKPDVLLLDEPLSNLDAHLRLEMRDLIRNLQREMSITTIFVTHDQEEAVVLADKIALILDGELKQYAEPETFYTKPHDEATARFFGGRNFINGKVSAGHFKSDLGTYLIPQDIADCSGKLSIRPENIQFVKNGDVPNTVSASVVTKVYMGTQTLLKCDIEGLLIEMLANPGEVDTVEEGNDVWLHFPKSALWVLPDQ